MNPCSKPALNLHAHDSLAQAATLKHQQSCNWNCLQGAGHRDFSFDLQTELLSCFAARRSLAPQAADHLVVESTHLCFGAYLVIDMSFCLDLILTFLKNGLN
jgi:hypothetical protein